MGRGRSSDSDSDHSRSRRKKKEKKKARSRSNSSSASSRHSSSRHKKSKKKHSSRKASPSPDRHRSHYRERSRRSRSRSLDRRTSSRRSRSPEVSRRRSRSPSYSRDRRSRSGSRGHRSKGHNHQRSRSSSRGHDNLRSSSRLEREHSSTRYGSQERHKSDQAHGMTSSELAEMRMRKALQAAALADKKLKGLGGHGSPSNGSSNGQGQDSALSRSPHIHTSSREFADSVATIESDSFVPSAFKSSRNNVKEEPVDPLMSSHDDAIFGSLSSMGFTIKPDLDSKPVSMDPDSIMHPSLFCNVDEKMDRWIERLSQLRRRKLEGDVMQ